jgi:hypothetical protein
MEEGSIVPVSCRAVATGCGDETWYLHFELRNRASTPIALPTYQPFTAFSVLATAGGKPLAVHQPALDIAVNPTTIHLPPGGAVTVHTPIRLRISEGADPGSDGFVWTIARAREAVSLRVELLLPAPFAIGCPVEFA